MKKIKGRKPLKESKKNNSNLENSSLENSSVELTEPSCPHCQRKMRNSIHITGLAFCEKCSLFYLDPLFIVRNHGLDKALKGISDLAGRNFIFEETCSAIVSNISPEISREYLDILKRLTNQPKEILKEWLKGSREVNDNFFKNQIVQEINKFISNITFKPERQVIFVLSSIRKAFNLDTALLDSWKFKTGDTPSPTATQQSQSLQSIAGKLNISNTEALQDEEIKFDWFYPFFENDTFLLEYGPLQGPKENKIIKNNKGVKKLKMPADDFVIRINGMSRYRDYQELYALIKFAKKPQIIYFTTDPPSPVYESFQTNVIWKVENSNQLELIIYYSDYNYITRDVSGMNDIKLSFYHDVKLVLKAKKGILSDIKECYVQIIPLPKFNTAKIPELTIIKDFPKFHNIGEFSTSRINQLIGSLSKDKTVTEKLIKSFDKDKLRYLIRKFSGVKL